MKELLIKHIKRDLLRSNNSVGMKYWIIYWNRYCDLDYVKKIANAGPETDLTVDEKHDPIFGVLCQYSDMFGLCFKDIIEPLCHAYREIRAEKISGLTSEEVWHMNQLEWYHDVKSRGDIPRYIP